MAVRIQHRGVAALEFTLLLPFLLILTFATTELGRAFYQYNTLTKSVRDGARYLSVYLPNTHIVEARNLIVYGNVAGTGQPLAIGLEPGDVPDPVWSTTGSAPVINVVTVRITGYAFQPLVTSVFGIDLGTFAFPDITATMRSPMV